MGSVQILEGLARLFLLGETTSGNFFYLPIDMEDVSGNTTREKMANSGAGGASQFDSEYLNGKRGRFNPGNAGFQAGVYCMNDSKKKGVLEKEPLCWKVVPACVAHETNTIFADILRFPLYQEMLTIANIRFKQGKK
jgi:hypothetical protein